MTGATAAIVLPDDHHPFVDVETTMELEDRDFLEWSQWAVKYCVDHFQINRFMPPFLPEQKRKTVVYRFHFISQRDATLFKLYFG
jgi:hypothetical protein